MTNGAAKPGGIITRVYKSGSIIYFEGDRSENIYILKSGRVILTSIKLDTGEEVKEDVRQGEFFGVKSSLGKYPREETAQTIGETTVLVMGLADFERLVLRNVNVVRKMLRVFSNQLRRIGKMVRSVLGEGDVINPDVELFRIGEYYYNAAVYKQALYAFKRYMEYYPDSHYAEAAMKRIREIESGLMYADAPAPRSASAPAGSGGAAVSSVEPADDMLDFGMEEETPPPRKPAAAPQKEQESFGDDFDDFSAPSPASVSRKPSASSASKGSLSDEMDDFLSDDNSFGATDDFSFDEPAPAAKASARTLYEKGQKEFSAGNIKGALKTYQEALAAGGNDDKLLGTIAFEMGRTHLKLGSQNSALESFRQVVRDYPGSPKMREALYNLAVMLEKGGQMDKALAYYQKIATLQPRDSLTEEAVKKVKLLQGK